ncbi:AAA family ATPase [Flavobacterium muglaense]|uniref:AAA family ATPase n=1 Tax=Flavobacterium muglaense TaxID=2764716 RepID=A0A923MYM1_9FLAO|nr:AAA family ATPase [Flavobacterium muglaense]MBC5836400.1 AAA family ATPase [Flavobacterium muglaense]MBC5842930.1 AAA family ATPase [Flavobacterium muglaense]
MERAKLIVKNFGPLKDIEIEVREMVTLIGAQASGKSTLAKLLSIFENENFRRDHNITFEEELKKYNIFSYLKEDSFIKYHNANDLSNLPFGFTYSNKTLTKGNTLNIFETIKAFSKEKGADKLKLINDIKKIINWDFDFLRYEISLLFKLNTIFNDTQKSTKFINYLTEIKAKHFDASKLLEILEKEESLENYINLYDSIIKIFPDIYINDSIYIPSERSFLHLIEGNTLGLIKNKIQIPEHILNIGLEYEKAIQTIKELPLVIINKKIKYKREGKSSYIYHNETEKVDLLESASGLQSVIPILLLVEYSKSLKDKYNFNFVVEEPELNLYPKAQHELIKYLVKNCLFDRKNLILTTHSPFVLASINNLLLAYDKGQSKSKEVNKIIKKESWLNPKNFIAYELKNGKAKLIMDDKLGQIKENMIDSVSDSFADEFDKLLDL